MPPQRWRESRRFRRWKQWFWRLRGKTQRAEDPFLSVIEAGLLAPGAVLTDDKRRWSVVVRADGTLSHGAVVGSIHKVGRAGAGPAGVQRLDVLARERQDGQLVSIDVFRRALRSR